MTEGLGTPQIAPSIATTVDQVAFKDLYQKSEIDVDTADGWRLKITRYCPVHQEFAQPIFGEPILLVHGFSQNRHAWTSGGFAKNLLYLGADLHILELRGHGKSSIPLQKELHRAAGRPLPGDLQWAWDMDSYLLFDLPAAVEAVKRATGRAKVFYCGHSMGGILGYGLASLTNDLEGLITIGSASDLTRMYLPLRMVARFEPMISGNIDATLAALNLRSSVGARVSSWLQRAQASLGRDSAIAREPGASRRRLQFKYVPMDAFLRGFERALSSEKGYRTYERLSRRLILLSNPARVAREDIRWLLRRGGEKEPRPVAVQFARWIRDGEMKCYRTGFDFRKGFDTIQIPMALILGDLDKLASRRSARRVYESAKSHYLISRLIKGNSHLELTMGHDIPEICADIKNLILHAVGRRGHSA